MALKTHRILTVPPAQLKSQLDHWASSDELRNVAFIKALSTAFESKLLEYYHAGTSPDDKLKRLDDICQAFGGIKFTDGDKEFTIASEYLWEAKTVKDVLKGAGCLPGEKCINGICVPGRGSGG